MKFSKTTLKGLFFTFCLIVSFPTYAHGPEEHASTVAQMSAKQTTFGIAGNANEVSRTIEINMTDEMQFIPNAIEVQRGETIRFVVTNSGDLMHELILGTKRGLRKHAAEMKKNPNMAHSAPYMAHVMPGTSEEIIWHFNKKGVVYMACLIDGHDMKGMTGIIRVRADIRPQSQGNALRSSK